VCKLTAYKYTPEAWLVPIHLSDAGITDYGTFLFGVYLGMLDADGPSVRNIKCPQGSLKCNHNQSGIAAASASAVSPMSWWYLFIFESFA
jgi:hypothetical protein